MKIFLMQIRRWHNQVKTCASLFVAAVVLCTGCNQIDNVFKEDVSPIKYELFTSFATTRTVTNDAVEVNWASGDALSVSHVIAGGQGFVKDGKFTIADNNLAQGKFDGTLTAALEDETSYDWYALYPYSDSYVSPSGENHVIVGCLSGGTQVQEGNSSRTHLAGAHIPLYGKVLNFSSANKPQIAMNQLLSVVKVHVTNTKYKPLIVNTVSFTASEDIVGEYSVNFVSDTPVFTTTGGGISSTANLVVSEGEPIEKNGVGDYYIAIKPFIAPSGAHLTISVNGIEKEIIIGSNAVSFSAGKIKTINFAYDANPVITMSEEVLKLNDETVWEQTTAMECSTEALIKVTPGQRFLFRHGNYHLANKLTILGYEDSDKESDPIESIDLVLPKEIMTIPEGVYYIRLKSATSSSDLTPEMCVEDDFYIIDVSGNSTQGGNKLWDWNHSSSSLTQGMACSNGYCFQAFADGYVDIWNIESRTFVESVFFPVASDAGVDCMHLNNLCFGDKYDASDTFGMLWGNNESIGSSMVGVRVTLEGGHFVFTKIAEVQPPYMNNSLYIADDQYIDFQNKRMVQVVYKKNDAVTIPRAGFSDTVLSYYSFDNFNASVAYSLVGRFEFPIMWAMQGGRVVNNTFYLVSGVEGSANCINVFNMNTQKCTEVIDLSRDCFGINEEPQGLEFMDDNVYLSTVDGFYRINI